MKTALFLRTKKIIFNLFSADVVIPKWKFKSVITSVLFIGIAVGSYLTTANILIPYLYAAGDTYQEWVFESSGDYSLSGSSNIEIENSSARLKVNEYASDDNTELLLHLNESLGDPTDSSGNGFSVSSASLSYTSENSKLNNSGSLNGKSNSAVFPHDSSLSLGVNHTLEAWIRFEDEFSAGSSETDMPLFDKGDYKFYFDSKTGKLTYELNPNTTSTWAQVGGVELNNSWDLNGKFSVVSTVIYGGNIYAGTGNGLATNYAGDAEVWRYNGTTWSQIGGNGLNNSWADGNFEEVAYLIANENYLFAGLGTTTGDAEVWRYNGNSWTRVGGKGDGSEGSSWGTVYEHVASMHFIGSTLYVGLGYSAGDSELWSCTDSSCAIDEGWTKLGGDGNESEGQSWNTTKERIWSITNIGTKLFVGTGDSAGDAEVWMCDTSGSCSTSAGWTKVGGDGVGSGWNTIYERVYALEPYGNYLLAGLGVSAGEAEVWMCDTSTTNNCTDTSSWTAIANGNSTGTGGQSWGNVYEYIIDLEVNDGETNDYLYVSVSGSGNGEAEVWMCDLASTCTTTAGWSQVGGDTVGSSWTGNYDEVRVLYLTGSTLLAGITGNSQPGELWSGDCSSGTCSWTQLGGNYINGSWGYTGIDRVISATVNNGKYYVGTGSAAGDATVWGYDGSSWTLIGGQNINNGWGGVFDKYETVESLASYNNELYAGLGNTDDDASVWKWNGTTWSMIGGVGTASGWGDADNVNRVYSLESDDTYLYAGLGSGTDEGDVWRWNGSTWEQIAGLASPALTNNSWQNADNIDAVLSLLSDGDYIYAGTGLTADDGEVWRFDKNTQTWERIGGVDALYTTWGASDDIEGVYSLASYNGHIYAGLGASTADAEVWKWDGSGWTQVAGYGSSITAWDGGMYEVVYSMAEYNGYLFVSLGNTSNSTDGEIWRFDGSETWTQVGGDGIVTGSWGSGDLRESAYGLTRYKGKLYAGLGNSNNTDAEVYAYGSNTYVQSTTSSFSAGTWYHVAVVYNGSSVKIYINGVEDASLATSITPDESSFSLYIGKARGSPANARSPGYFKGMLDELRISSSARSSFNTTTYSSSAQTVSPVSAVMTQDISQFTEFVTLEDADGGTVRYRLSHDGGTTWYWYTEGSWIQSSSLSESNTSTDVDSYISLFDIGTGGVTWQGIMQGNGEQRPTISSVRIDAYSDTANPDVQDTVTAKDSLGGSVSLTSNNWYSYSTPYFSWDAPSDNATGENPESGVWGYWVYFGDEIDAEPSTQGSFQTTASYTASEVVSGTTYYLRIKTRDYAQNVSEVWTPFIYKYDSTGPTNPSTISVSPSGYASTNSFTFSWATATDAESNIAGYQYKTDAESGDLSEWSETITERSITITDSAHTTGENTFYMRSVDNAGNTSSSTSILFYFGGDGPSTPLYLGVDQQIKTINDFAFTWDPPETHSGEDDTLTYCYTVNTTPTENTCTFTAAGVTAVSGALATQVGLNTFYVVAKNSDDYGGGINYGNYTSVAFTANTSAPGIPLSIDVSDISVKSSSTWRLTVSWNTPTDTGSGVSSYKIYRSTDDVTYAELASTTGTAYVDTALSQVDYYYKVKACDSVENCGAFSSSVTELPTGKYTSAPVLTADPAVSGITTKNATISWSTDRTSDSRVQYGESSGTYFDSEPSNSTHVTSHEIDLENLSPGKTYYVRTRWTDEDGNIGTSDELSFSTDPAPTVKDVTAKTIGLTTATLQYTTTGSSKVKVYYGKTSAFGGVTEVSTSTSETTYTTSLEGLEDGTKYYYKINTFDTEDEEYEGTILSFTTLPAPKITNVKIQEVKGTAQPTILVTWETNTEVSSIVTYYPKSAPSEVKDEVNVTLTKGAHKMIIRGLIPQTEYILIVKGRDKMGNEAASSSHSATTATDTRPPFISNLKVEGSILPSKDSNISLAQLVVSWNTDEPSSSQVEFGEGTGVSYSQKTQQDSNMTYNHLVVISNLTPSKVYHLRALSVDSAGNEGSSIDIVTITPKATESALNLVITNLSEVFGFLKGVK